MIKKTTSQNVIFLAISLQHYVIFGSLLNNFRPYSHTLKLHFFYIFFIQLLQEPQHQHQLQVQPLIEAWFSCTISPKTTSTFAKLGIWFLHWPEIIRISLKVLLPWSFKVSKWRIITWISSDFWPCWPNCQAREVHPECLVLPGTYEFNAYFHFRFPKLEKCIYHAITATIRQVLND